MEKSSGNPTSAASAESYVESMYAFFCRERLQNLMGQTGASVVILLLTWDLADRTTLVAYLIVHQLLVATTAFFFYSSWANVRLTRDGLPRYALPSSVVTKIFCGSLFWFDLAACRNVSFVLSVIIVLASCVAGSIVTMGPLKRMARMTLLAYLLPGALACLFTGHYIIGLAMLFFLYVVAYKAVEEMHVSFRELISLRSQSARIAATLEANNDELRTANENLEDEVRRREATEREREKLQEKLVSASREAGKAEIATGVLHNVGNVMNSVNVTACVLEEEIRDKMQNSLEASVQLLSDHKDDLPGFFERDPRGQHLVPFLSELNEQSKSILGEIKTLRENIEHVNAVVAAQQEHAMTAGVEDVVSVCEVMDSALQITQESMRSHQIEVVRDYHSHPEILLDKQKLIQVLVNLLRNAKDAINEAEGTSRRINICIEEVPDNEVVIRVADTGIGISQDNVAKIFQHGFSTKKDRGGHGFGLHHSVCAIQELGGRLTVLSEGLHLGATFTIALPANEMAQVG